ncbi:MAG TPA: hypothetical protein VJZ71_01665 [Phycisphaerae bacterium]|nr:hypothetical protein [Phycisphaerae bacterium]
MTRAGTSRNRWGSCLVGLVLMISGVGGCAEKIRGPVVFYLDGAGWYASAGSVESGLRKAGYKGSFRTFSWSAFLGPAHDHLITAKSGLLARQLARRIEKARAANPDAPIHVMGLSAGTSLILRALEELEDGVKVDNVVLFSSSASSEHNLTRVMRHVRRNLYATTSPHDSILSTLPVNADGKGGPPAGRVGFRFPRGSTRESISAYQRVVNLPWQPTYLGFGWNGSHTSVTGSEFVAAVIAPRVLTSEPYPLDRSIAAIDADDSMECP